MGAEYLLTLIGIPGLLSGGALFLIKRWLNRKDEKEDEREAARKKHNLLLIQSVQASLALGQATAHAIQNGRCNGEMAEAMRYAVDVEHKTKDFLAEQGMENII